MPNFKDSFFDKIKKYIDALLRFFDSGVFFQVSWKWLNYHFLAILFGLLPVALIVGAVKIPIYKPATFWVAFAVAFIFLSIASFLSILVVCNRAKNFDEITKKFSANKVTLGNFYDFFRVAFVHSVETSTYAFGIFASVAIFGLAVCSLFVSEIKAFIGWYVVLGFVAGPVLCYIDIFITKIIVLFLTVFLEYLPKLLIIPVRALYNLFGIIIDARHNLWKKER